MSTSAMTDRIELRQPTGGVDEAGQPVAGFVLVARVWADVRYLPGMSAIKAGADVSMNRASVRIYTRAVDAGFQVVHAGRVLEVDAVNPVKGTRFTDLVCRTVS